jgi:phasin family protein
MSAKAKAPEAIDVGTAVTEQGSSPKARAKDSASVILKGNVPTAGGPLESDGLAKVKPDETAAVALTTPSAVIARDEKASSPDAKPDDQPVVSQTVLPTETVPGGYDSPPQAKSDDQEPVSLETSPPAEAVRAEPGPLLTAKADEPDAASLEASLPAAPVPAASVPPETDPAPDRIGLHMTPMKVEELVSLGQGNFAALLQAGQIWTTGLQQLATQVAASAKASLGETLAVFTALSSAKSPQDALDLQTKLVRSALEKTLADSGRIGDASVKLLEQTLAPLTARATLTVETFSKRVA